VKRHRIALLVSFVLVCLAGPWQGRAQPLTFDREESEVVIGGVIEPLSSGARQATGDLGDAMALFAAKVDDPRIQSALAASNRKTSAMKTDAIVALDVKWKEEADGGEMGSSVLSADCSDVLRNFSDTFRQFESLIVTDAAGVLVCASEKPEAYFFGNQDWWVQTMKAPAGRAAASATAAIRPGSVPTQALYAPVVDPDNGTTLGVARAIYASGL
jgi:hypothetical protein